MSALGDKLRKMGTDIYSMGDAVDAGVDIRHPLPPTGLEFPPKPLNEQGSWTAPDGTEYVWINHITSSAIGGPAEGYWARVAKPGEGPGAAVPPEDGETPL